MSTAVARLLGGRYTSLLIILLVLSAVSTTMTREGGRDAVVAVGFSVVLVFAVLSVGPRLRLVAVGLALPAFASQWLLRHGELPALRYLDFAFTSVFLSFLTLVIIVAVFRDQAVTADTIVGAICAYFLIGVTWGTLYALLITVSPDALSVSSTLEKASEWRAPSTPFSPLLLYYSFTTLATLGYGDVTPLSAGARALSVMEGLTGQLYLAVLVARLVGIHTAGAHRR